MNLSENLVKGIVSAICLGLGTVLMRASIGTGESIPIYLVSVGSVIALSGCIWAGATGLAGTTTLGLVLAVAIETGWTVGIRSMAYGSDAFSLPVSIVASPTNSNTTVAALLGALMFGEWRSLRMPPVAIGTLLICAGATCGSSAK